MINEKGSYKLHVSFLPIIVLVGIIFGAGYFLLKGDITLPKLFKSGTEIRRLEGFPTTVGTSKILTKQRKVLTSQTQLNDFLALVDTSGTLGLNETINFNREYLLAVSSDTFQTEGNDIVIKKVYSDKAAKKLQVSIRERNIGDDCHPELKANVAVDIVAITKTDWEIDFDRVKEYAECPVEPDPVAPETVPVAQ